MKSQVWPEQKYHSALIRVFRVGILKWEAGDLAWLHVWYMAVEQVTVFSRLVPIKIRSKEFEWGHFLNRVGFAQIIVFTGAEPDKSWGRRKLLLHALILISTHTTPHHPNTFIFSTLSTLSIYTALSPHNNIKSEQGYLRGSFTGITGGTPCKGLIYFSYICCLSCQMLVVLVTVWSESQLYLLFTGGEGGGSVVSPSIGESQLTKLTR